MIALGAGAVADPTCYGDALGSAGAWLSRGAAGQHAAVAKELVRRLALAFGTATDLAHDKGITGMSLRAAALVAARQIFAQGIETTRGLSTLRGTFIKILALASLCIAFVALATNTNTAASKCILNTAFAEGTRIGIGAADSLWCGAAFGVSISRGATGALA